LEFTFRRYDAHAVSDEEYELAAEIRDYLKKHSENG
jgi:protein-arginine kinase activator protein McsA